MSEPFVGEIRAFPFNFAPRGWAVCSGQLLAIAQNTALFSLLGTQYGGNGTSTFGLPNLNGAAPLHTGQGTALSNYFMGETAGTEYVTLTTSQVPAHTHTLQAATASDTATAAGNVLATFPGLHGNSPKSYAPSGTATPVAMSSQALGTAGSSLPHENRQPFLVLTICIATQGIYPSRA